jgi:hypothetical protein
MIKRFTMLCLLLSLPFGAHSQSLNLRGCEELVSNLRKQMPLKLDEITKRVDARCLAGWTKTVAVVFYDELTSDIPLDLWREGLRSPEKVDVILKMQCSKDGFGGLLRFADVIVNYKVNGTPMDPLSLSEQRCEGFKK